MVFAEAGLLAKTPAAVHFEALQSYREAYADPLRVPPIGGQLGWPEWTSVRLFDATSE